jgi:hypothetical protein
LQGGEFRAAQHLVATAAEDRLTFRCTSNASIAAASDRRTIAIYEYTPRLDIMTEKRGTDPATAITNAKLIIRERYHVMGVVLLRD